MHWIISAGCGYRSALDDPPIGPVHALPFLVVLPVFALIFAGWLVRRLGVLGPHATTELNRFVVYLALPALLFDIMAHTDGRAVAAGFIAVFGLSSAVAFG